MSAQANITAFDGASTPVTHTFVPDGSTVVDGGVEARWKELSSALPDIAKIRIRTHKRYNKKTGMYRAAITVEVPIQEAVNGQNSAGYTAAAKIAYTNVMQVVLFAHERSSDAERRLIRQLTSNFLGNISTSVATVNTGFAPEFIDQLIVAS